MSDFIDSAKNFVGSAVNRAAWETQKQMRVRGKQGEIDKLMEQRQQFTNEIVQNALDHYVQGTLTDPNISRLCASIVELDHDVKNRQDQLLQIKNEPYPADQFAPGPTANYTPPPFTTPTPPPSAAPGSTTAGQGQPHPQSQGQPCPNCGNPLRPGALYCRSCGAKVG